MIRILPSKFSMSGYGSDAFASKLTQIIILSKTQFLKVCNRFYMNGFLLKCQQKYCFISSLSIKKIKYEEKVF
jgi:hypothetical protein